MSRMHAPGMYEVLAVDLYVPLALVAVVEAVDAAVPVASAGPRPARPRHVERLLGRGVRAGVLDHGDAVLRAPAHLVAAPPV